MGTFRVEVQATGNHGCERSTKATEKVEGCKQPGCVDCITRDYIAKLKASGAFFETGGGYSGAGWAKLTHWPGLQGTVVDDLLTGVRAGSF